MGRFLGSCRRQVPVECRDVCTRRETVGAPGHSSGEGDLVSTGLTLSCTNTVSSADIGAWRGLLGPNCSDPCEPLQLILGPGGG